MPYVTNQGVRIHYQVEGEGSPLLLMHGFTAAIGDWYEWGYVDALKGDYRLVLVDARGHGASDKPHTPEAYRIEVKVSDILAVLDALGLARARYFGYGWGGGGLTGFGVVRYAPQRFKAVVIGAAHPYGQSQEERDQRIALFRQGMEAVVGAFEQASSPFPPAIRAARLANDTEALVADAQDWPDIQDALPVMTMPCLLYAGEKDPRHALVAQCARQLPHAVFVSLPGLDYGQSGMRSDVVLPHVVGFLQSIST